MGPQDVNSIRRRDRETEGREKGDYFNRGGCMFTMISNSTGKHLESQTNTTTPSDPGRNQTKSGQAVVTRGNAAKICILLLAMYEQGRERKRRYGGKLLYYLDFRKHGRMGGGKKSLDIRTS